MPITRIDVELDVDGSCDLGPPPTISIPNQQGSVLIVWTIVGAEFDPDHGIEITSDPDDSITESHLIDAHHWSVVDTNDGSNTQVIAITYNINYICDANGKLVHREDPTIDNQPPTG